MSTLLLRHSLPVLPRLYRRALSPTFECHHFTVFHSPRTRLNGLKTTNTPPVAFVIDIDGVLFHGDKFLAEGKRALQILEGSNSLGMKIPYILLTNGGGVSEQRRCQMLTHELGFPHSTEYIKEAIHPTQYIQAHTILKTKAHKYADSPVLVLGGVRDDVRSVAKGYGFNRAYTTHDVLAWNPSVWPLYQLTPIEKSNAKPEYDNEVVDFSNTIISAILVFHDPRQWALDIQIMCDILQAGGIVNGPYISLDKQTNPVELVFCNPDLIWRSAFERPRLGQGAFITAFQAVYKALTGSTYPHIQYGKPTQATYKFAQSVLTDRLEVLYGHRQLPEVYMVGDNPESDIAGANAVKWSSVIVHTGVYDPLRGDPTHLPTYQASNIEEAVKMAIHRESMKERK